MMDRVYYVCRVCERVRSRYGACVHCHSEAPPLMSLSPIARGETAAASAPRRSAMSVLDVKGTRIARVSSGFKGVDRVTGGGFAKKAVYLLTGKRGIGKSTLIAQIAHRCRRLALSATGEESLEQVADRQRRVGAVRKNLDALEESVLEHIFEEVEKKKYELVIYDSLQVLGSMSCDRDPGSELQMKEVTRQIVAHTRSLGYTAILVGHETKAGEAAGPGTVMHLVDCVLSLRAPVSVSRPELVVDGKNRYGSAEQKARFKMTANGLVGLK